MRYKESQIKNIEWPKFEDFITFQYVFMKVVKDFVRQELWVNVPVAIFFPTVHYYISRLIRPLYATA